MRLVCGPSVRLAHLFDFRHEIIREFILGYSTNRGELRFETDIQQIVEHGEQGDLRKLCYTRDKDETLKLVVCLEYGKHLTIESRASFMLRRMPGVLQRSVVFVDKYYHLQTGLPICRHDDTVETYRQRIVGSGTNAIQILVFLEYCIEI